MPGADAAGALPPVAEGAEELEGDGGMEEVPEAAAASRKVLGNAEAEQPQARKCPEH